MKTNHSTDALDFADSLVPDCQKVVINHRLFFEDRDGYRVVFCRHEPLHRFAVGDKQHRRLVAVSLRLSELATQAELAEAFAHSVAAQRRWEENFKARGVAGLLDRPKPGRPATVAPSQHAFLIRWFGAGVSLAEMARRLAVSKDSVQRSLKRLGLQRRPAAQPSLPFAEPEAESAASAPTEVAALPVPHEQTMGASATTASNPQQTADLQLQPLDCTSDAVASVPAVAGLTIDRDPADRAGDRLLARQGLLADALPLFADAEALPCAGVLLAIPLLVQAGVLGVFAKVYKSLGPAFYGLRTTIVIMFVSGLLRIKRPENLKEYRPGELGRIVGLDRAPEVKTVRRKLSTLAAQGQAKTLMNELAGQRIAAAEERIAFLYLDGHVREYHGKAPLAKTKKAQRGVATPAATDTWVNDAAGEPLLVITSQINAGLTGVLKPILEDVKGLVPDHRRLTVIFDRGGWSPKLFAELIAEGFDVITYRKGKSRPLPRSRFREQQLLIDGQVYTYQLCDRSRVRVGRRRPKGQRRRGGPKFYYLREIRVLRGDGRQTVILTNRTDLEAVMVVYRMFNRWRQENYFKYMAEEFALDALAEYGVTDVDEAIDRPNPQYTKVKKELDKATAKMNSLRAELGLEVVINDESKRCTMRGFKQAHTELRDELEAATAAVGRLCEKLTNIPKRIPANDLRALKTERKLIADSLKMVAYQAETQLLGMLAPHYARTADEGRTLLQAAFASPAQLEVSAQELRVTIAAQSSPHRTRALAALGAELDALGVCFPGTNLRLRLAVEPHQPLTL